MNMCWEYNALELGSILIVNSEVITFAFVNDRSTWNWSILLSVWCNLQWCVGNHCMIPALKCRASLLIIQFREESSVIHNICLYPYQNVNHNFSVKAHVILRTVFFFLRLYLPDHKIHSPSLNNVWLIDSLKLVPPLPGCIIQILIHYTPSFYKST